MKEYNLFAEGYADEGTDFSLPGMTKLIVYIKGECAVCKQVAWLRRGVVVCNECIP